MRIFARFLGKSWSFWLLAGSVLLIAGGGSLLTGSLRGYDQIAFEDLLVERPKESEFQDFGSAAEGMKAQQVSGESVQARGKNSQTENPQAANPQAANAQAASAQAIKAQRLANALLDRVLEYLTWGPPLEAKLRMRAWAAGQAVTEVGRYEQAGQGTGRTFMDLHVPIADGNARWQQTCDGRLAWTREELGQDVLVRRVDLGLLEELLLASEKAEIASGVAVDGDQPLREFGNVSPRFRVGGLAEIVDRIQADYELSISEGFIENVRMLVVKGTMREALLASLKHSSGGSLSPLVPQHVRVAIEADSVDSPLPSRIEFWSEPAGKLISLLEIYDVTTIEAAPAERFRFEAGGDEYLQETDLYLRRFSGRD